MRNIFSLLLCSILVCCLISSIKSQNNETDRLALISFKERVTRDPRGVLSSWNNSVPYCHWTGVECSKRHTNRVTALRLLSYGLEGSLSPYIGNLTLLKTIILRNNSFEGEIPSQIGGLFRLRYLDLRNNSFQGQLPKNLTNLADLSYFNVIDNRIVGRIPSGLSSLSKLKSLLLTMNNLTGSIPASLGNLSSLVQLSISRNGLTGTIPNSLGKLQNLILFQLSANRLTGNIPPSIYNLSALEMVYAYGNRLEGTLSENIGNAFPHMKRLSLSRNRFSGSIPLSLINASSLEYIYLAANEFTGPIPKDLSKLKNLKSIILTNNNLGSTEGNDLDFIDSLTNSTQLDCISISANLLNGPLVSSMVNLSIQVKSLIFGGNLIYGSVPAGIGNLINLEVFSLAENHLTGIIPVEIGKLRNLHILCFPTNKLSGTIPSSLGNLTLLNTLNLRGNAFTGQIPPELSKLQALSTLVLSQNNLTGPIPKELMYISSLSRSFNLSHNALTGSLPLEVGKLINLEVLDLSSNNLSGQIPSSLGSCVKLLSIDLDKNSFTGEIPRSLSSLKGLQYVDLSQNDLSGRIPAFLGEITLLTNLNISYNKLSGEVPTIGIFRNASIVSVSGNHDLCGGIPELDLPTCLTSSSSDNGIPLSVKLGIVFASAILCSTIVAVILILRSKRLRKMRPLANAKTSKLYRNQLERISYSDVQKATEGFSESNLIGHGSFGSVYKGILEADGPVMAIKVLNLRQRGASKSFISECIALKNIRHRNLLKLVNACSSVDFQGNQFKALVYEYMSNGNLDEWLHSENNFKSLSLLQRLDIAMEVATVLEYLHHQNESIIVHSDLKPSNILLDQNMTAHLGDFGLAKIISLVHVPEGNQTSGSSSTIPLKGSIGYIPPEYGTSGNVTREGDVYSFGIVLLEMFTGKRPTDAMFSNGLTLHDFVKSGLEEETTEILDPVLVAQANEHQRNGKNVIECCCFSMMRIGFRCSLEIPKERIDIEEAVSEIHSIKDSYFVRRF